MKNWNRLPRFLLVLTLLIGLCAGFFTPTFVNQNVKAAPATNIVISEFRTRGPAGAEDEFVEIYNPTSATVNIGNWQLRVLTGTGTEAPRANIPAGQSLSPGQYYLIANNTANTGYSDTLLVPPDLTYVTGIVDDGGIALFDGPLPGGVKIDSVGFNTTTALYTETTPLSAMRTNIDQSNERNPGSANGNCVDTNVNTSDFIYNSGISFPQNLASAPIECISVTDVTSTTVNGTYIAGDVIPITVTFSGNVNVNLTVGVGTLTLLIENGGAGTDAMYVSGNGTNTLTFDYIVANGDVSADLDYVESTALSLIDGTITGVTGGAAADLTLPAPGATGSLGANKAIIIDNQVDPSLVSISRQVPTTNPTNAASLTFRVIFSEPVTNVDPTDFVVHPNATPALTTTATVTSVSPVNGFSDIYAVTISGGNLSTPPLFNGDVGLDLSGTQNIADAVARPLTSLPPTTPGQVYTVDNVAPTVTINQAASPQIDPTTTLPINFVVVFSEPINVSTFTASDITQGGAATGITWSILDSGDHKNFTLSATTVTGVGTLIPSIAAGQVADIAGNTTLLASTSSDNTVTYNLACTTTSTSSSLSIVINEVAWAGTAASVDDEWIELYNPPGGIGCVLLNGWQLTTADGSPTIDLQGTIQDGAFFLLEYGDDFTVSNIDADQVYTSGTLSNNGEKLYLKNNGFLIDSANANGTSWPFGTTAFQSMERRVTTALDSPTNWITFNGGSTVQNGLDAGKPSGCTASVNCTTNPQRIKGTPKLANWFTILVPTPTRAPTDRPKRPTKTPIPTLRPVGRPFINEFLPRPGFDWNLDGKVDTFDEFIELKNVGNADLNLNGWKLDDEADHPGAPSSAPYTITDIILKPGEYAVFYGSKTNILLSDGGDSVRLFDGSGALVDVRDYTIAKVADESVCRLPDGNAFGSWFSDCTPTPNLTNSRESNVPTLPDGNNAASLYCDLPDTLPADFLFAECRGYGANIWDNFYWDEFGWKGDQIVPENKNKWKSFIE